MPQTFPKDRFDHLPRKLDRVGAHRAPGKKGRRWIAFWWALAATILLIALGIVGLFFLNDRLSFDVSGPPTGTAAPTETGTPTPTETAAAPTIEPTVDPSLSVTVLNGTPAIGVAGGVRELLTSAGWTVGSIGDADSQEVPTTIVYYADPALEGAARGVAGSLPGSDILLSNNFAESGAALTVIVGNDYVPPTG